RTKVSRQTGEEYSRVSASLYSAVHEHLAGAKVAKSYGAEARCAALFTELAERMSHIHIKAFRHYSRSQAWFTIGSVSILSVLVLVAVKGLALPTASLLLLLFLFARVIPRLAGLNQCAHIVAKTLPAFETIQSLERRCLAAAEP